MKRYIIAGLVLVAAVIGISAATANYPTNVYDLPLSRMSRAQILSDGNPVYIPTFQNVYATYTFPVMPFAYALTEITRPNTGFIGDSIYIEIDGSINRLIYTNAGNSSGLSDANNFVIKSPVFIPPGSQCRIVIVWGGTAQANSAIYVGGYALQPGEY